MKVVINSCYGGFGLSVEAKKLYLKLSKKKAPKNCDDLEYWYIGDIDRTDKYLIKVVEKLKDRANGSFAKLRIVEIPDGIAWKINEYDGNERIDENHRSWG